jgi:streptogramin lyase
MRLRLTLLAVALAAALSPSVAQAVTIQEFPIEPGAAPGTHAPLFLKAGPDGNLWIANRGAANGIQRITTSGQRVAPIPAALPHDIAFSANGAAFWTESGTAVNAQGGVVRRTADGTITSSSRLTNPVAIALAGEVPVIGTQSMANGNGAACTADVASLSLGCRFSDPAAVSRQTSIVVAPGGQLWTTAFEENRLRSFQLGAQAALGQPPLANATVDLPPNSGPLRAVLGPDGALWVTMFNANRIDRIGLNPFSITPFQLPPGLKGPHDITVGPDGALWFTEFQGNQIGRITTSGQITEFPIPTPGSAPYGITTGADGAIWFTQNATGSIGRLVLDRPGQAGGPAGGGGGGGISDQAAPRFTEGLAVTRSSFRAGTGSQRGTTFEFSLSEPGRVAITIERRAGTGRRVNGRCMTRTRRNRGRPTCTRYTSVGTLRADGRQGENALRFSGRLNGRTLGSGTYRATAVATDAAGNASGPSRVTFTVRRR